MIGAHGGTLESTPKISVTPWQKLYQGASAKLHSLQSFLHQAFVTPKGIMTLRQREPNSTGLSIFSWPPTFVRHTVTKTPIYMAEVAESKQDPYNGFNMIFEFL